MASVGGRPRAVSPSDCGLSRAAQPCCHLSGWRSGLSHDQLPASSVLLGSISSSAKRQPPE